MSETVVICTHGGTEHVWDPAGKCPDSLTAGTWAVKDRPAPDATAGKLRQALVSFLFERYSSGGLMELRGCQADADAVLALPALRDVLAAAARDAELRKRVEELLEKWDGEGVNTHGWLIGDLRDALDPS